MNSTKNLCVSCKSNRNPPGIACELICCGLAQMDENGFVTACSEYRMNRDNVNECVGRELFVHNLESLLRRADLDVDALTYIYPDPVAHRTEAVEIAFKAGGKKRVCIEADSRAAIIKDVLRGCE